VGLLGGAGMPAAPSAPAASEASAGHAAWLRTQVNAATTALTAAEAEALDEALAAAAASDASTLQETWQVFADAYTPPAEGASLAALFGMPDGTLQAVFSYLQHHHRQVMPPTARPPLLLAVPTTAPAPHRPDVGSAAVVAHAPTEAQLQVRADRLVQATAKTLVATLWGTTIQPRAP
jgi:hypothetical protein